MALRVVGNFYKHSAWPQLRKGAVTCRASWFLQIMDAQRSKERWEKTQGQELGCSWRWAEVSFLPCRALSHSMDFGLVLPVCLFLQFLGRKWYFPAGMLLWLDTCFANACLKFFTWFQRCDFICLICWQMTSVFYLLPHQGVARPQQVPLCQGSATMAALSQGSQSPGSHLHKLILCHSKIFPPFFNVDFLMERALEKPGCLTCEK